MEDPRFAAAKARKEAALARAAEASKALERTVAQVSATNMHDKVGADRARPLDRVRKTSALAGLRKAAADEDDLRERRRRGEAEAARVAPMVAEQRAEWHKGVRTLKAQGLPAPRDFHGAAIGDSTDAAPADAASAGASAASSARGETEAERAERKAMERARKTVMRTMGIPDAKGPKVPTGPHLVDHVKALRQFSSAGTDAFVSESRAAYSRDAEFEAELRRNASRTGAKLKKNAFTEYTEAVALYTRMMGSKK